MTRVKFSVKVHDGDDFDGLGSRPVENSAGKYLGQATSDVAIDNRIEIRVDKDFFQGFTNGRKKAATQTVISSSAARVKRDRLHPTLKNVVNN